jgi:MFS family permease
MSTNFNFGASVQTVGLVVPAYLIQYGIATLYGLLADRLGIHRVMFLAGRVRGAYHVDGANSAS